MQLKTEIRQALTRLLAVGVAITTLLTASCQRSEQSACARVRGHWTFVDIESAERDPNALELARQSLASERWELTPSALRIATHDDTIEERARIQSDTPSQCELQLTRGRRVRVLTLIPSGDQRMRVRSDRSPLVVVMGR